MTNDPKPATNGDAIQITLPVKGTAANPAHVQLDGNNYFYPVEVQVDPANGHSVESVWAIGYLESETEPSTAIGGEPLNQVGTTNRYRSGLTLNGCGEKFGIVATAELSDSATSETLDPINDRSRLTYFGDCARFQRPKTQRPARAAKKKKKKAGTAARKPRKVTKMKAKTAAKKTRKKK